jgi:hypothetical protein
MSSTAPTGATPPLYVQGPQGDAGDTGNTGGTTDVHGGGLDDFHPQVHEIDPPYCPGVDPGRKWHLTAHRADVMHPGLMGTQVGSEG